MITLYHNGASVCAAKTRMALNEKKLDWESKHVNLNEGEHLTPEFLKLNPKGLVPVLINGDDIVTESTLIIEYVEELFPENPLFPQSAFGKAQMRKWTKAVDEELHPACAALTFVTALRHVFLSLEPEQLEEHLSTTPEFSITPFWKQQQRDYIMQAFDAPGASDMIKLYDRNIQKMNNALEGNEWLIGDIFTAADVAYTPYIYRLECLGMSGLWENGRMPNLERWWQSIKERPSFKQELVKWMPEELIENFMVNGSKSWGEVCKIVGISN